MSITMYGIRNCDTVKKARAWLTAHGVDYGFHDYKTAGIDRARLQRWCDVLSWEAVLNRSGTTFRRLAETERTGLNAHSAVALMLAQPSMIRRPVLDLGDRLLVGFKAEQYERELRGSAAVKPARRLVRDGT